jgi:hypothetical protein
MELDELQRLVNLQTSGADGKLTKEEMDRVSFPRQIFANHPQAWEIPGNIRTWGSLKSFAVTIPQLFKEYDLDSIQTSHRLHLLKGRINSDVFPANARPSSSTIPQLSELTPKDIPVPQARQRWNVQVQDMKYDELREALLQDSIPIAKSTLAQKQLSKP